MCSTLASSQTQQDSAHRGKGSADAFLFSPQVVYQNLHQGMMDKMMHSTTQIEKQKLQYGKKIISKLKGNICTITQRSKYKLYKDLKIWTRFKV